MLYRTALPWLCEDHGVRLISIQLVMVDGMCVSYDVQQSTIDTHADHQRTVGNTVYGATAVSSAIRRRLGRWLWLLRMRQHCSPLQLAEHTGIDAQTLEQLELGQATTLNGTADVDDTDWDRMQRLGHMLANDLFEVDLVVVVVRAALGLSTTIPNLLLDRIARELPPPPVPTLPR
jgi:transcriptional regulator with XRE-family HTH domain